MKIILLIVVIMCIAYIDARAQTAEDDSERLTKCREQVGMSPDDVLDLVNKHKFDSFEPRDYEFACCRTEPLISDKKLDVSGFESYVKRNAHGVEIDVGSLIGSCEMNGINSNNLKSCEDIAKFFACVDFEILEEVHYYNM